MNKIIVFFIIIAFLSGCSSGAAPTPLPYDLAQINLVFSFVYQHISEYAGSYSISFDDIYDTSFNTLEITNSEIRSFSVESNPTNIKIDNNWYKKEPYKKGLVHASIYLEFSDDKYEDGTYQLNFYLVKDREGSNWQIVHVESVDGSTN